jgi:hypothetical protein
MKRKSDKDNSGTELSAKERFLFSPAALLLDVLNSKYPSIKVPLRELILNCLRLQDAGRRANPDSIHPEVEVIGEEVQKEARKFRSVPLIWFDFYAEGGPRLSNSSFGDGEIWFERDVFNALRAAIDDRGIEKIKQCGCRKYFFQTNRTTRHCSHECYVRDRQKGEKYLEYQKNTQRRYYYTARYGAKEARKLIELSEPERKERLRSLRQRFGHRVTRKGK